METNRGTDNKQIFICLFSYLNTVTTTASTETVVAVSAPLSRSGLNQISSTAVQVWVSRLLTADWVEASLAAGGSGCQVQ